MKTCYKATSARSLLAALLITLVVIAALPASPASAADQPVPPVAQQDFEGSLLLDGGLIAVVAPVSLPDGSAKVSSPTDLFASDASSFGAIERGQPAPAPAPPAPGSVEAAELEDRIRDRAECDAAGFFGSFVECPEATLDQIDEDLVQPVRECVNQSEQLSQDSALPAPPAVAGLGCLIENGAEAALGAIGDSIVDDIETMAYNAFIASVGWVMEHTLGPRGAMFQPTVDCATATDGNGQTASQSGSGCSTWFNGQLSLMAKIGLWIVVPLMILVVIQSVIRGSMFLMVRSFFILLPAAILGTIAVTTLVQMLLNISDEMSAVITNVVNSEQRQNEIVAGLKAMGEDAGQTSFLDLSGVFGILVVLTAVIAAVVVIVELMLREVGIYLSVLFLPLCFAAMVWPSTVRWAKRLVEVLIGLIFMKVIIAAAISLSLAAIAGIGDISNNNGDQRVAFLTIANVAVMMAFAAFAPTKLLKVVPGGSSAMEGRMAQNEGMGGLWRAGEGASMVGEKVAKRAENRAKSVGPRNTPGVK